MNGILPMLGCDMTMPESFWWFLVYIFGAIPAWFVNWIFIATERKWHILANSIVALGILILAGAVIVEWNTDEWLTISASCVYGHTAWLFIHSQLKRRKT